MLISRGQFFHLSFLSQQLEQSRKAQIDAMKDEIQNVREIVRTELAELKRALLPQPTPIQRSSSGSTPSPKVVPRPPSPAVATPPVPPITVPGATANSNNSSTSSASTSQSSSPTWRKHVASVLSRMESSMAAAQQPPSQKPLSASPATLSQIPYRHDGRPTVEVPVPSVASLVKTYERLQQQAQVRPLSTTSVQRRMSEPILMLQTRFEELAPGQVSPGNRPPSPHTRRGRR